MRFPSSPLPTTNFSHLPSLPAPITNRVALSNHPMIPLAGLPPGMPGMGPREEPGVLNAGPGSSPVSKCAEATEYTSENTLGSNGILPRIPHFWFDDSSLMEPKDPPCIGPRCRVSLGGGLKGCGKSKICKVDLSEVTARRLLSGEMAMEKIVAWSTPRRSSAIRAQLRVANIRIRVP